MTDLRLQKTKYHFWEDIVHGWCEKDEDEDEALAGGVVAVPLLLHRLAVTSFRCLRLRSRLRVRVQPRIHCSRLTPGATHSALRLPTPTAPGSPSAPPLQDQHPLLRRGPTTDASTTSCNECDSR